MVRVPALELELWAGMNRLRQKAPDVTEARATARPTALALALGPGRQELRTQLAGRGEP